MKKRRGFGYYRLNPAGEPEPCTMLQWARWLEARAQDDSFRVKVEWVENAKISTVFLGLDHSFIGPIPILWETMTFSNRQDFNTDTDRCGGTREQAEAMHVRMVASVRARLTAQQPNARPQTETRDDGSAGSADQA